MRTVAAGVVLLVAAVSGCSSGDAPPAEVAPLASGTATEQPEAQSSPSSSGSPGEAGTEPKPSSASASVPPSETARSASDFVRQFFDTVNEAYARTDASAVRALSTDGCGSCAAVAADVDRLAVDDHEVAGRRYIVSFVEAAPPRPDGKVVVDFRFTADPYVERDAAGSVLQRFPAEGARDGQVLLETSAERWRVAAIRLIDQ